MSKGFIPRALLAVFFVALIATPLALRRFGRAPEGAAGADAAAAADSALRRYGFRLEEVSKRVGVDFTHAAPRLDAKLEHIMPQVASMGAAVSVVDFDRDGWQDLYVTNSGEGSRNALFRNNREGTFTNVADSLGVADLNHAESGVS